MLKIKTPLSNIRLITFCKNVPVGAIDPNTACVGALELPPVDLPSDNPSPWPAGGTVGFDVGATVGVGVGVVLLTSQSPPPSHSIWMQIPC